MADYITSTSTSSLHSSPTRKRTRESHTTRSSSYLSTCKTAATVTSNVEVMESCESEVPSSLPSITQPRSSIHSIQNGLSSLKSKNNNNTAENGLASSSHGILIQPPIAVSTFPLKLKYFYTFTENAKLIHSNINYVHEINYFR